MLKSGQLVSIRSPKFEELAYISFLWSDEKTMKDVGGAIEFKKEGQQSWYERMVDPGDHQNVYCLIFSQDIPVGEVSFHRYNKENKSAEFNIKIESSYRGYGYVKEATVFLLDYYFNEFKGEVMLDEVTSLSGQQFLSRFGFEVVQQTENHTLFKLTKEMFNAKRKNK